MRFVVISDTHNRHPKTLPDGDVLIHAGDFTMVCEPKELQNFQNFLMKTPFKSKIVIAGNHDIMFDEDFYIVEAN